MTKNIKIGDVFLIPLDDAGFGVGQVAGNWQGELYLIIYEATSATQNVALDEIMSKPPWLAALSLDAKLWNGDWPIIGNVQENLDGVPQPVFKVNQDEQVFLESRDRSISRPATAQEEQILRLRNVVAPIRLENALKARHGIGSWNPRYDELLAEYATVSSKLL
jgi:Immunity protein 26